MAGNDVVIHVKAEDHASRDMDVIGNKVETRAKRSFGRVGTSSGLAFAASFIKTITFGQVGGGFAQAAIKMSPQAAKAGGVVGVAMGAGIILQLTNALSAGLPLALGGALLAGPLIHLWKTQEKAVKRLKDRAKDFIEFISEPVKIPFLKALDTIGDGLEKVGKPLRRMLGSIAPALEGLTKGAMKGLEAFILAIEPAMPTVAAGMEAWGKAAPRIGKAMGDFIAKIMDDPEATVQAIEDLTDTLIQLAGAAGNIVSALQDAAGAYGRFARTVDKFEESTGSSKGGPLGGMANAVKRGASQIRTALSNLVAGFRRRFGQVVASGREMVGDMRSVGSRVAGAVSSMASRAVAALGRFASGARSRFNQVIASGQRMVAGIRSGMSRFASAVSNGASRAMGIIRNLGSRIRGAFANAGSWLVGAGRGLITGLISGIRSAAGAAASAAANVVRNAAAAARRAIPGFAHGGIVGGGHAAEGGPRGGLVLVGEQGPELVNLPGGSHVYSNSDSRRMASQGRKGGGDTHFHFHGPVYGDHNALRRALVNMKRSGQLDVVLR